MWIKLIMLLTMSAWVGAGDRQKRTTLLTDESKRILDIFDFSNFDKQEALNYIDRQRFENLIRGKRSKWDLKNTFLDQNLGYAEIKDGSNLCPRNEVFNKCTEQKDSIINKRKSLSNLDLPHQQRVKSSEPVENGIQLVKHRVIATREDSSRRLKHDGKNSSNEGNEKEGKDDGKNEGRKKKKRKKRHHWGKWSKWSRCSVTCGKGRRIRSRRCIAKVCPTGELEMGEKICQLPACSVLEKIFNFFK